MVTKYGFIYSIKKKQDENICQSLFTFYIQGVPTSFGQEYISLNSEMVKKLVKHEAIFRYPDFGLLHIWLLMKVKVSLFTVEAAGLKSPPGGP